MTGTSFQVGDRIKVRASNTAQTDRIGTIVQVYLPEEDIYDVELDVDGFPQLMLGRELELLSRVPFTSRELNGGAELVACG
jgi:hypothetical protein